MERRVLYVTGEYPPMRGGVADYTERLVTSLEETGWRASILTSRAAAGKGDPRVLAWINRWAWSLSRQVQRAVRETGASVVHIQYQTGAFAMHPAVNLLPIQLRRDKVSLPVATTFHDLRVPYLFPKAGRLRHLANRVLAIGSDAVIATNEDDKSRLLGFGRISRRTTMIPIGSAVPDVTEVDRDAVRERLGISQGEQAIGFFGFLTEDKGVDLLLDALERMPQPRPRLVVIGGDFGETDGTSQEFHAQIRARLDAAICPITVTGHLPAKDVSETLAALDLLVYPFRHGGSIRSSTLIASVRSGTPIVTTDPDPAHALAPLVGGESVWLVPPSDVDALRAGIQLLLRDQVLRDRLSRAARNVAPLFDWPAIARHHAELYESLLKVDGGERGQG